jgi:hypothetical protein
MMDANPYRTPVEPARPRPRKSEREERWPSGSAAVLLVLLAVLAWALSIAWSEHRVTLEIAALPQVERATVYRQTMEQLRTVCSTQPGLRDHCIHQAELALKFPECDDECRALAAALLERTRR